MDGPWSCKLNIVFAGNSFDFRDNLPQQRKRGFGEFGKIDRTSVIGYELNGRRAFPDTALGGGMDPNERRFGIDFQISAVSTFAPPPNTNPCVI